MTEVESLSVEILKQIRTDLKDGLAALRQEVGKTNERLDKTNEQLNELKEMQNVLAGEHRKTNQRLDFFAEELVRMRTRDIERIDALERAVAELQRRAG